MSAHLTHHWSDKTIKLLCNHVTDGLSYRPRLRSWNHLQVAQNALTRVVRQALSTFNATQLRLLLHWQPIQQCVEYKLALKTYSACLSGAPAYYVSFQMSTNWFHNWVHQIKLKFKPTVELFSLSKGFNVSAPTVWKYLSYITSSTSTVTSFEHLQKTYLFSLAYWNACA
jgi:hypothetical protein